MRCWCRRHVEPISSVARLAKPTPPRQPPPRSVARGALCGREELWAIDGGCHAGGLQAAEPWCESRGSKPGCRTVLNALPVLRQETACSLAARSSMAAASTKPTSCAPSTSRAHRRARCQTLPARRRRLRRATGNTGRGACRLTPASASSSDDRSCRRPSPDPDRPSRRRRSEFSVARLVRRPGQSQLGAAAVVLERHGGQQRTRRPSPHHRVWR